MSEFEVDAILTAYNNKYKEEWERTRWLAFILSLPHSDKLNEPKDLVLFSWDDISPLDNKEKSENVEQIKHNMLKVAGVL